MKRIASQPVSGRHLAHLGRYYTIRYLSLPLRGRVDRVEFKAAHYYRLAAWDMRCDNPNYEKPDQCES